jgi:hypothetical protein
MNRQSFGKIILKYALVFDLVLGHIHPPIQGATEVPSPGIKRPRREANNSPPSSAEVKNARR